MKSESDALLLKAVRVLLPLISQQMLTAERVLLAVGHQPGVWNVPPDDSVLASLRCVHCQAEAGIHLVDGDRKSRYTVLLLPSGHCGDARYTEHAARYTDA